ncbi:MAG: hypothetical protein WBK91_06025 [Alphaproteobacteria bacterium]
MTPRIGGALACVILLSGCASIIEGRSQQITINTNPAGADCTLIRNGTPLGHVNPTPGGIYIEKTKYDMTIECAKEGYDKATYMNKSGVAGATVGNIVAGGLIGWGVDSATGADNKYDSPVNLTLNPLPPPPPPPVVEAPAPKKHKNKK